MQNNPENQQKGGDIIPLFTTPIFTTSISETNRLKTIIEVLKTQKPNKVLKNEIKIGDELHQLEEMKEFSSEMIQICESICDFNSLIYDDLQITSMWATISTSEDYYHPRHIHPNSYLSGIVYIDGPENCSGTMFYDPRPAVQVFEPDYKNLSPYNSSRYESNFSPGKVLIFPSWLPHGVDSSYEPYKEDDARITLSFNIMFSGKIIKPTAQLTI